MISFFFLWNMWDISYLYVKRLERPCQYLSHIHPIDIAYCFITKLQQCDKYKSTCVSVWFNVQLCVCLYEIIDAHNMKIILSNHHWTHHSGNKQLNQWQHKNQFRIQCQLYTTFRNLVSSLKLRCWVELFEISKMYQNLHQTGNIIEDPPFNILIKIRSSLFYMV